MSSVRSGTARPWDSRRSSTLGGSPPSEPAWFEYWILLSRWWRPVLIATAVATLATGLIAKFYLQKRYEADAVLTPVAKPLTPGSSSLMGGSGAGSIVELLGGSLAETSAQEYMSILKSFAFTISLAGRHSQIAAFALDANAGSPPRTQWQLYKIINDSFGCDYDIKTGNLTLSFVARTRADAQRILGYYVDDLRDKLRGREMHDAGIAVASLREQINKTSDALLQSQLYELMANQLQREKLAQIEADFAFSVIEPPVASDKPCRPRPFAYCVLVATLVAFLSVIVVLALETVSRIRHGAAVP